MSFCFKKLESHQTGIIMTKWWQFEENIKKSQIESFEQFKALDSYLVKIFSFSSKRQLIKIILPHLLPHITLKNFV